MAVAFDAVSTATPGTGNLSWTHTPVGTPRGVIVLIVQGAYGAGDEVTSVTYGGVSMTEMSGSPNTKNTVEGAASYGYFLGASIPTGAQSVVVTVSGGSTRTAVAITLTANNDTEIIDSDGTEHKDSAANPSVTLSLNGRTSFAAIGFFSGQDDVSGITPLAGWTSRLEYDFGSATAGFYTYDTVSTSDVTAGWTQTAEDDCLMAVAVSEKQATPAIVPMFAASTVTAGKTIYGGTANFSLLAAGTAGFTYQQGTTNPQWAPLSLCQHVIAADYVLVAGFSAVVSRYLEISAGITLEIGADSDLEIT